MSRVISQIILGLPSLQSLFHPDVVDYAYRIRIKGATIQRNDLLAINRFTESIYAAGLRSLILECYPFAGDSIAAARTKLWYTSNEAFTNNGFTSGNYGRTTGITGNGTSFLNSNFVPSSSSLTTSDGSIGCYIGNNSFEPSVVTGCTSNPTTNYFNLIPGFADNLNYFDCYNATLMQGRVATPVSAENRRFHVGTRVSPTNSRYFQNGVQTASISTNGGVLPAAPMYWFAFNNNGTAEQLVTAKSIRFGFVGKGLTPTQVTTLTSIVNTLMTELGRAV